MGSLAGGNLNSLLVRKRVSDVSLAIYDRFILMSVRCLVWGRGPDLQFWRGRVLRDDTLYGSILTRQQGRCIGDGIGEGAARRNGG